MNLLLNRSRFKFQSNFRRIAFQQDIIPSFYYYDINSKLSFNPTGRDIFSLVFTGRDYLDKSRELDFSRFGGGSASTEFDTRVDENLSIGAILVQVSGSSMDLMYKFACIWFTVQ